MRKKLTLVIIVVGLLLASIAGYFVLRSLSPTTEDYTPPEPVYKYGICIDSLKVVDSHVQPGETLSTLLQKFFIDQQTINTLVQKSRGVFDVRRIRAGNRFSMLCLDDSLQTPRYFIYEDTPTKYIVFRLTDSLVVYSGEKEVERRVMSTSGTISSSLWNSMIDKGLHPTLALELSDVFAWTIDFFAIQKNDSYRLVYEQIYLEGKPLNIGRILSACFSHVGKEYYAFYFTQDGKGDYFDQDANSLRKAFLKAPLKFSRISSHFSSSRLHPVLRIRRPHHGVDYAAPTGTPVLTIGEGTVTKAHYSGGAGKMVEVRHNSTYTSQYLHLSKFGNGIRPGVRVSQGQVIGYVGSTGLSTGPHLDFRVYRNGGAINPLTVESPPSEPVKTANREEFLRLMQLEKARLDSLRVAG